MAIQVDLGGPFDIANGDVQQLKAEVNIAVDPSVHFEWEMYGDDDNFRDSNTQYATFLSKRVGPGTHTVKVRCRDGHGDSGEGSTTVKVRS